VTDAKPIENWSFLYCRLQGETEFRGEVQPVTTTPVVSIEGDIATTKSGSKYLLGKCKAEKTREEWIKHWEYWNGYRN
jgi:hypothetical protein